MSIKDYPHSLGGGVADGSDGVADGNATTGYKETVNKFKTLRGAVAEDGSHNELLTQNGIYALCHYK